MAKVPEDKVQKAQQEQEQEQAEQDAQAELQREQQAKNEEERLQRIEDAPKSGIEAQEKLQKEVDESDGRLGGDSGTEGRAGGSRPEQDADVSNPDKLSDGPPTQSTR